MTQQQSHENLSTLNAAQSDNDSPNDFPEEALKDDQFNEYELLAHHTHAEKAAQQMRGNEMKKLLFETAHPTPAPNDETAMKLKQIIIIEEVRKDVGEFRTKFELGREAFEQHKKTDDARDVVREIKIEEVQHKRIADLSEIDCPYQLNGDD